MTLKAIKEEAAFIEEMMKEYVDMLDEGNIIDIVIDHMNDTLKESCRFKVFTALEKMRSRDRHNWSWIIRSIRNTGLFCFL